MKGGAFNNIILASASPRRKLLLENAGVDFRVEVSGADEVDGKGRLPRQTALSNALIKARAVSDKFPEDIVLGADTVVVLDGKVFGKPVSREDAVRILEALSGKAHTVITAIALVCKASGLEESAFEESLVKFKILSPDTIRLYMKLVDVMDKAGAYGIQEHSDMIIEDIRGNVDNVMGLPCGLVLRELEKFRVRLNSARHPAKEE